MDTATVEVKSGFLSKINWTQVAGFAATLFAYFGLPVDPATLVAIIVGIQAVQSVITVVIRQFFTKTVMASSLPK